MVGRTNVGGGGGNAVAYIKAIYPEGSTCTCSNGSVTLRARDKSGVYIFPVPSAGMWAITSTNGTLTKTEYKTVGINDVATVFVLYNLVIYDNGVEETQLSGGILPYVGSFNGVIFNTMARQRSIYNYSNCREFYSASGGAYCMAITGNAINVDNFTTLHADLIQTLDNGEQVSLCLSEEVTQEPPAYYVQGRYVSGAFQEATIDLTNITGNYYIRINPTLPSSFALGKLWLD